MRLLLVAAIALVLTAGTFAVTNDPGTKGWMYVVNDETPSVIAYEGTYPNAQVWTVVHTGAGTTYTLPKGAARCNPTKRICIVRW